MRKIHIEISHDKINTYQYAITTLTEGSSISNKAVLAVADFARAI